MKYQTEHFEVIARFHGYDLKWEVFDKKARKIAAPNAFFTDVSTAVDCMNVYERMENEYQHT